MRVGSELRDASLQTVQTADEAGLAKTIGKIYFNRETNEILIGDGSTFSRIKVTPTEGIVGDIKTSILSEAQFATVTDGTWTLADGKDVTGSDYATLVGSSTVPDLRGQFLRGKNNGRVDGNQNPDGDLALGSFSADKTAINGLSIQNNGAHYHNFDVKSGSGGASAIPDSGDGQGINFTGSTGGAGDHTHALVGDNETAPNNVTVNYFIKINT